MKDNRILISSVIVSISIVLSVIIYSCLNNLNRYEFKADRSQVIVLDKRTGLLYITDGKQIKEIRLSDKRVHDYVDGEDIEDLFNKIYK